MQNKAGIVGLFWTDGVMLKVGKNAQLFSSQFAFDFSVKENNALLGG